jgi:hypothetical protein
MFLINCSAAIPVLSMGCRFAAMQAEFKPGDTMILDRTNGAGMTVRYLLPRPK